MIQLDVGCPMLGFDQSFTMFFSCISLSSSKLCLFRKTYTAKQPRWRSSKRVAASDCRRNRGFSPPKVELWAPTCNWFLGPPCTSQLAHMIWWKWGIGVAKRLTMDNSSLHFSILATEILGRQLMYLLDPSIYFVGISLRLSLVSGGKKGVLTATTSQPFSSDWGYQFSFKGSQSISARPSCTKEQLILVLGQARGGNVHQKVGGDQYKMNIISEVNNHIRYDGVNP